MSLKKQTAREVFDAVVDIGSTEEQGFALDNLCVDAPELRREVESLLESYRRAGSFLEAPVLSHSQTIDNEETSRIIGQNIGPYKLIEQIGEGGFGQVFWAEQQQPIRRAVAIKLIKPGMDSREVISRFEGERQALAVMNHPNIAKVLDAGTTSLGRPYFVMELVRGVPITEYCDQTNSTARERIGLFLAVCDAIQHAHQQGIIHRDIKPGNILVTSLDGRPVPKVINFGVAKALHQGLSEAAVHTRFHQMLGTPLYMSPEQAEMTSSAIDTRSDIYSLGVLLYELITGSTPFDHQRFLQSAVDEIRRIIREEDPPIPSTRLSESGDRLPAIAAHRGVEPARLSRLIRGDLDWIVMKALEKDRTRRYSTADNFAKDIQRYLNHEPVEAGPPSRLYRARKFIRRNRGSLMTATVLLSLVLAGSAMSFWQAMRATQAKVVAVEQRDQKEAALAEAIAATARAERAPRAEGVAKSLAEQRQGKLENAIRILGSVFQELDPGAEEKLGKPLRLLMGEHLDAAIAELEGDNIGDPEITANLQNILGKSLVGLGEPDKGTRLLKKSVEALSSSRGAEDAETLKANYDLACAYRMAGRFADALALSKQILETTESTLGAGHPDTILCRENLALLYLEGGNPEAVPAFEESLAIARKHLGPRHPQTLSLMKGLARAYLRAGQVQLAIEIGEEIQEPLRLVYGPRHPTTIMALGSLAAAYESAHQYDKAIELATQTHELSKERFGPDHPETLTALHNLANSHRAAGHTDRALRLSEESLRLHQLRYTADNPNLLSAQNNLALVYLDLDHPEQAIPLLEEVLRKVNEKLGPEHPNAIITLNNLASAFQNTKQYERALPLLVQAAKFIEQRKFRHQFTRSIIPNLSQCYERLNRPGEGEIWLREWLAAVEEEQGSESVAFAGVLGPLGWNLLQQERWVDAETVLRQCFLIQQTQEPNAYTTFMSQSLLGEALLRQARYAEAEPFLLHGYQGLVERQALIPPKVISAGRLTQALERLPRLYIAWGQLEKSRPWQEQLDARKSVPDDHEPARQHVN